MNFSAISNRTLAGRVLRLPLSFLPRQAAVPIVQGRLRGKRWIVGSSNHGCWLGSYEHEKRTLFEQYVGEGMTVFDVGAHVGFYTLLASELVGCAGNVVAFEPLPKNLSYLREHLQLNDVRNVCVVEAAVSDHSGSATFNEGTSSLTGRLAPHGRLRVKTVSLDDFVSGKPSFAPDCIKIDVEGGEAGVLKGARRLLAQRAPTLFLATHGEEIYVECSELLRSVGYELFALASRGSDRGDEVLAIRDAERPRLSRFANVLTPSASKSRFI